jgi:hypothetical protein
MNGPRSTIVDARGAARSSGDGLLLPELPGLPPLEPIPELLVSAHAAPSPHTLATRWGRRPRGLVSGMPVVADGTRAETRPIDTYHVIDVSPSNAWTDSEDARFFDFAFVAREWAANVVPDDRFIQVLFDSAACIYPPCVPREVPKDGWRHRPTPSSGGTCFVPPVQAVIKHAARFPDHAHLLLMYSDGMGDDVAEAHTLLVASGIPAVLIPYGPDFPWLSAGWAHTAFRIAAHVDDRRHAIAQTVALAIVEATGHQRTA